MCGIAGIVCDSDALEKELHTMMHALRHRGPSGSHYYITQLLDSRLGVAQCQLSLANNTPSALPYINENLGILVILDGALENAQHLTSQLRPHYPLENPSDAELIAAAYHRWGKNAFAKLEGTFAMAIYDRSADQLLLIRDRLGIKPLFYTFYCKDLYFASEIKALFATHIPKRANAEAWINYLLYSAYEEPHETFWENINTLPGGYLLSLSPTGISLEQWYDFAEAVENTELPRETKKQEDIATTLASEIIEKLFSHNTQPALCLSDGSSIRYVTHIIRNLYPHLHFSLLAFGKTHLQFNLISQAKSYADEQGYPFLPVMLTDTILDAESLRLATHSETPFCELEAPSHARLFRLARQQGINPLFSTIGLEEPTSGVLSADISTPEMNPKLFQKEIAALARPLNPINRALPINITDHSRVDNPAFSFHRLLLLDSSSMSYSTDLRSPFLNHRWQEFRYALSKNKASSKSLQSIPAKELTKSHTPWHQQRISQHKTAIQSKEMLIRTRQALDYLQNSALREWFCFPEIFGQLKRFEKGEPDFYGSCWKWINLRILIG